MRAVMLITPVACLFGIVLAAPASAQKVSFSSDIKQIEAEVLTQLNLARSQPAAYVETLTSYRGYFKANLVVIPGHSVDIETLEGTAPVDEAIDFLQTHSALKPVQGSDLLNKAAAAHAVEQASTGGTGHFSANGAAPADRTARAGGGRSVAEVIAYGAADAEDVVRQLIIDDGVPDRGHRVVLFSDHLRYVGIACGPHPEFGTMCVVDLADTPNAMPSGPGRRLSVATADDFRRRR